MHMYNHTTLICIQKHFEKDSFTYSLKLNVSKESSLDTFLKWMDHMNYSHKFSLEMDANDGHLVLKNQHYSSQDKLLRVYTSMANKLKKLEFLTEPEFIHTNNPRFKNFTNLKMFSKLNADYPLKYVHIYKKDLCIHVHIVFNSTTPNVESDVIKKYLTKLRPNIFKKYPLWITTKHI